MAKINKILDESVHFYDEINRNAEEVVSDYASDKVIANVLYNMSLDMDYADAKDTYEEELHILESEIQKLREKDSPLYWTLEAITEKNMEMKDQVMKQGRKNDS